MAIPIIVLIGVTASGKTEIALNLAQKLQGEIISSDSVQIYKYLDIGSAKPSKFYRDSVPHYLIDVLYPNESYSAANFQKDADAAIQSIYKRYKKPFIVGGNSLYVKILIKGVIRLPDIKPQIKEEANAICTKGIDFAYNVLKERDIKTAENIDSNDKHRIVRALEVFMQTGSSIYELQQQHLFKEQRYRPLFLGINADRDEVYKKINYRTELMVKQGLIEEVVAILEKGYTANSQGLQSIGYKQVVSYLENKITKNEMIRQIQKSTRNYAKRQWTWFKMNNQINWFNKEYFFKSEVQDKIKKHLMQ